MPIKSLELFLFERGLVGSYPIEALKNAALGIDVNHYLSRLLTNKREQYLDAIGGFPTSLKMYLESDLKIFKEYKITPIFVFQGSLVSNQIDDELGLIQKNSNSTTPQGTAATSPNRRSNRDLTLQQRNRAWTQWQNLMKSNESSYIDQPVQPQEPFRYNTVIDTKRFQADLINYFIENGITYQVAPFSSWIQLSYLLDNNYIDAIYGPTDCLMLTKIEKFIIGMEFPNKEFRFVDRARVLKDLDISHEEFVDIAMAVGNDLQPITLPPLQIYPTAKVFEVALDMVFASAANFYAFQSSNPMDKDSPKYAELYQKGYSALRYMPVLTESGRVELYVEDEVHSKDDTKNSNKNISDEKSNNTNKSASVTTNGKNSTQGIATRPIPNDVHDFICQRLPHEYYFYQSIGLIGSKLYQTITSGSYIEESPLDGGASNSYRELIKKSVSIFKNKEIGL
ncbi:hypothetical protein Kpol_1002p116, partial [Vanderwaltozyma polyspora DSM 70294]